MARTRRHPAASPPVAPATQAAAWSQWPRKVKTLQFNAVSDLLGVFSRYVAALAAARDIEAIGAAQQVVVADWIACLEAAQRQWAELALVVPPAAWGAIGWRLKPGVAASAGVDAGEPPHDLFEQSKLGFEMLLWPWIDAPDLDHTDEFVA